MAKIANNVCALPRQVSHIANSFASAISRAFNVSVSNDMPENRIYMAIEGGGDIYKDINNIIDRMAAKCGRNIIISKPDKGFVSTVFGVPVSASSLHCNGENKNNFMVTVFYTKDCKC